MSLRRLLPLLIIVVLTGCSSGSSSDAQHRVRRSQLQATATTKTSKLPPLKTSTTVPVQNTTPVEVLPFLSGDQISATWTDKNLCSQIPLATAQSILDMDTQPTAKYAYDETSGARCTYASSEGDEMYIEYSTSTYSSARAVDTALHAEGTPVVVKGIGGVYKSNKALGATYELNVSGADSNEWIVNAPQQSQAKGLAETLIDSLD